MIFYKYQFAYLDSATYILDLITIYNCGNSKGSSNLLLQSGTQNIFNINISYNNNRFRSGINFASPTSMLSNYCTFYNNTAHDSICISFYRYTGTISKSNIILNNSPSNGVVYVGAGVYNLSECVFVQNQNILLYVFSGMLRLNNCFINHLSNSITTNTKTAPIFYPTLITSITNSYQLTHYQTQFSILDQEIICYAENPLPYRTPEMTPNPTKTLNPTNTFNPTISKSLNPSVSNTLKPSQSEAILQTIPEILLPAFSNTIFPTDFDNFSIDKVLSWTSFYYLMGFSLICLVVILIFFYFGKNYEESISSASGVY